MMSGPLITIITVCLNAADYIEDTIKSVISQDYDEIEYIIIDGGSMDGTLSIIDKYYGHIDKIISEADAGIYDAMNKGIRLANGEFIGFLNAGDMYTEGALKALADRSKECDADIFYGDVAIVDDDKKEYISYKDIDFEKYYLENPIIHQSIFVRSELQKKYSFKIIYRVLADYHFFLNRYHEGYKFCYLDTCISLFRAGGVSSTDKLEVAIENRDILFELISVHPELQDKLYVLTENVFYTNMFELHLKHLPGYKGFVKKYLTDLKAPYQKFVLFGAGRIADEIYPRIGIDADYFIDNDGSKNGNDFHGAKVYSVDKIIEETNCIVIILNRRYALEMKKQIEDMELQEKVTCLSYYEFAAAVERSLYSCNSSKG